jgi:hypothetical protein
VRIGEATIVKAQDPVKAMPVFFSELKKTDPVFTQKFLRFFQSAAGDGEHQWFGRMSMLIQQALTDSTIDGSFSDSFEVAVFLQRFSSFIQDQKLNYTQEFLSKLSHPAIRLLQQLDLHNNPEQVRSLSLGLLDSLPALRSMGNRKEHVKLSVEALLDIANGNFDNLHRRLLGNVNKDAYVKSLQRLKNITDNLTAQQRCELLFAVVFHNIGTSEIIDRYDERTEIGINMMRNILKGLVVEQKINVDAIAEIIADHIHVADFGVNAFPATLLGLPYDSLLLQVVAASADSAGKLRGNMLTPQVLECFLGLVDRVQLLDYQGNDRFFNFRIGNAFAPITYADNDQRMIRATFLAVDQVFDYSHEGQKERFIQTWQNNIAVNPWALFYELRRNPDDGIKNFAKFIKLIYQVFETDLGFNHEGRLGVETDMDYLTLERNGRLVYLNSLSKLLANLPDDLSNADVQKELMRTRGRSVFGIPITLKGNRLVINISQLTEYARSQSSSDVAKGGIDLNVDSALSVQNNGQGIKFHLDPAILAELQNAPGFVPVIISVRPVNNLREFLNSPNPSLS